MTEIQAKYGIDERKYPIKGTIIAKECSCCGHHEIGIIDETREYVSLKPGMKVTIHEQSE